YTNKRGRFSMNCDRAERHVALVFGGDFWTYLDAAGSADGARDRNRTGTPAIHESGGF
ncbi:MAG: hypothetical protein RL761_466, partial [Pseudomonadota bacterium]